MLLMAYNRCTKIHTFFSIMYGSVIKIEHILDHRGSLKTFHRINIIQDMFLDHNARELEINHRKRTNKTVYVLKVKTKLLNNSRLKSKSMNIKHLELNDSERVNTYELLYMYTGIEHLRK